MSEAYSLSSEVY